MPAPQNAKKPVEAVKSTASDLIYHLAFDISLQANIISAESTGEIIDANLAACKLLGYAKKELLNKNRKDIFNITEGSFIRMLKKQTASGHAKAEVKVIKKSGLQVPCQITSVTFVGDHGINKFITTMVDMRQMVLKQKNIDTKKHDVETRLKTSQIAEAVSEAHEQERSDIGKELHDNINQLLGVSRLYIEMARKDKENKEIYLRRSSEYTMNAIEEIRKLTRGIITDVIRDIGLCEAIDATIKDTMEIYPVKIICTQNTLNEKKLDEKFKMNIFRMVQEQLNNILKHAGATKVTIDLLQNKKQIILSISDNGMGFDIAKKSKGVGIANITSRAKAYEGIADFASEPGKGCVLTVTFPITAALLNKE